MTTTLEDATSSQRRALRHHCRLAGEAVHPRFSRSEGLWSVVLTVNSGYE